MAEKVKIVKKVAEIYDWLDEQIRESTRLEGRCRACGDCCNFEEFDHRLFVTPPELIYLASNLGVENLESMPTGRCPYNIEGRCSIYEYRFAGCRIFSCSGHPDFQSRLSETVLEKFKTICTHFHVPYRYTDLPTALNKPDVRPMPRSVH